MKLLIFTQKVDTNDTTLGFFHAWIQEFSNNFEKIYVICLEEGIHSLPKNVTVLSLGKEKKAFSGLNKLIYIKNLYSVLNKISGMYDGVFVHMNQEYILSAGLCWKMKKIPVFFWRNHPYGNIFTRIAVLLSTKVFCTSRESFTARYKKTIIMPVGADTTIFKPVLGVMKKKYSVCIVGRIAPVKHIDLALQAITEIIHSGGQISLSIIGSPLPKDISYYEDLKKYVKDSNLGSYVVFLDAVPLTQLPEIYSGHEICLNLTSEGSFDKTIVEAAACGAVPIVASESLSDFLPKACITERDSHTIAASLKRGLLASTQIEIAKDLEIFVKSQSLEVLMKVLITEIHNV